MGFLVLAIAGVCFLLGAVGFIAKLFLEPPSHMGH
jgi:preprotein translocase subunit Sss1